MISGAVCPSVGPGSSGGRGEGEGADGSFKWKASLLQLSKPSKRTSNQRDAGHFAAAAGRSVTPPPLRLSKRLFSEHWRTTLQYSSDHSQPDLSTPRESGARQAEEWWERTETPSSGVARRCWLDTP